MKLESTTCYEFTMWKWSVIASALGAVAFFAYSTLIEVHWLEVSDIRVAGQIRHPITVAHLTDLHVQSFGNYEKRILKLIQERKPDLIVITGDTVDSSAGYAPASEFLHQLSAPLGVYAVRGNWENWTREPDEKLFYEASRIRLLVNESAHIRKDLEVIGFDDYVTGTVPTERDLATKEKTFCIALFHSPGFFPQVAGRCPIMLAGHTHGGQIRLPFLGPLWLPRGSNDYLAGWYESKGSRMYVSRGLGTSIAPIRFLARPELVFLTIEPKSA